MSDTQTETATPSTTRHRTNAITRFVLRTGTTKAAARFGLPESEATIVSRCAAVRHAKTGEHLCTLGGVGRGITLLVTAEAHARRVDGKGGDVPAGSIVGELSTLRDRLFQIADVTVTREGQVIEISDRAWRRNQHRLPVLAARIEELRAERRAALDQERYEAEKARYDERMPILENLGLVPGVN